MHNGGGADAKPSSTQCSSLRLPAPTAREAACPPPRHRPVIDPQGHALGGFEQFCTIATSYRELIQMKVLHGVKKHDPITMPEVRLTLLEPLQDHTVSIRNRP